MGREKLDKLKKRKSQRTPSSESANSHNSDHSDNYYNNKKKKIKKNYNEPNDNNRVNREKSHSSSSNDNQPLPNQSNQNIRKQQQQFNPLGNLNPMNFMQVKQQQDMPTLPFFQPPFGAMMFPPQMSMQNKLPLKPGMPMPILPQMFSFDPHHRQKKNLLFRQPHDNKNKANDNLQQDPDHFVVFKNRNLPPQMSEVIGNIVVSLKIADAELINNICKKAINDIEKRCRDNKQKKFSKNIIEIYLPLLEKEQQKEEKEQKKKQSGRDDRNSSSNGSTSSKTNLTVEAIKLVHEESEIENIFSIMNLEKCKIDINDSVKKQNLSQELCQNNDSDSKLFEDSLRIFNLGLNINKNNNLLSNAGRKISI